MFIGSINQDLRAILNEMSENWKGKEIYVGCSGNFTVERILSKAGISQIHGNDVSLYSCAIGYHLTGQMLKVKIADPEYAWLEPYIQTGPELISTLLLCSEIFNYAGRSEPYHRRMYQAYMNRFKELQAQTTERVLKALEGVQLKSFYDGDVLNFMGAAPDDCVAISFPPTYCLGMKERILTADLRWVPSGDISVGDKLFAFDEYAPKGKRCRCWRVAEVLRSEPVKKECVRVHLENGDSIVCTIDHPWLAKRHGYDGAGPYVWTRADNLIDNKPYVIKPVSTWKEDLSYDAGWIAGMFDGEASIRWSRTKKGCAIGLSFIQNPGIVLDRIIHLLSTRSIDFTIRERRSTDNSMAIDINGGTQGVLSFLGTIRPIRLIDKLINNELTSEPSIRTRGNPAVKVTHVEPVGIQEVQSIETSTRTYLGEGYLMHNSGGYERLYRKIDQVFEWDRPDYRVFDDMSFMLFTELIMQKSHWVTLRDHRVEEMEEYLRSVVRTGMHSKPVYVYAGEGKGRITLPRQKVEPVPIERLNGEIEGELALVRLTQGQMNTLRSQYLSKGIVPAAAQINLGVVVGGKLIGALAFPSPTILAAGAMPT